MGDFYFPKIMEAKRNHFAEFKARILANLDHHALDLEFERGQAYKAQAADTETDTYWGDCYTFLDELVKSKQIWEKHALFSLTKYAGAVPITFGTNDPGAFRTWNVFVKTVYNYLDTPAKP